MYTKCTKSKKESPFIKFFLFFYFFYCVDFLNMRKVKLIHKIDLITHSVEVAPISKPTNLAEIRCRVCNLSGNEIIGDCVYHFYIGLNELMQCIILEIITLHFTLMLYSMISILKHPC